MSYSAVNFFYYTRYFTTLLIFLLFKIFSTFHSLTFSISTGFTFFYFLSPYLLSGWILIKVSSCSLTTLVETTLSMKYKPIYQSTSFFTGLSLNTESFILNNTLSPFFSFLSSFICLLLHLFLSPLLQSQDLRVGQVKKPCIRVNIRELNRELYIRLSTLYTLLDGPCYYYI